MSNPATTNSVESLFSTEGDSVSDIVGKVNKFKLIRNRRKKEKYTVVWYSGLTFLCLGLVLSIPFQSFVYNTFTKASDSVRIAMGILANIFLFVSQCGFLIVSTVDPSAMIFNDVVNGGTAVGKIIRYCTFTIFFYNGFAFGNSFQPALYVLCPFSCIFLVPEKYSMVFTDFSLKFIAMMIMDALFNVISNTYGAVESSAGSPCSSA
jgi:hypothetical protein